MDHFNGLTPAEAERLALLAEELGECTQAIGKILRHGYESRHPDGGPTNRESLEKEVADVMVAAKRMINNKDLSINNVNAHEIIKRCSVERYLHHQSPISADNPLTLGENNEH